MKWSFSLVFSVISILYSMSQEVHLNEMAGANQIFGLQVTSDKLLPMNDLNIDCGYVLYESIVNIESADAVLEVENIRDYAAVYINGEYEGVLRDNQKKITLHATPGNYIIQLYVENIGRITYGPEILDNSKGLFGRICIDGEDIDNWKIIELKVRNYPITDLKFTEDTLRVPGFHKGFFDLRTTEDRYLNTSGWGMGEAWVNGVYIGSYWEVEKQKSILIPASVLKKGSNEVVVFELKENNASKMMINNEPEFN